MFTNEELLRMLEKAELVIKVKNHRIIVLENTILSLGGKIPPEDMQSPVK